MSMFSRLLATFIATIAIAAQPLLADAEPKLARIIVGGEAYGQGIWYSLRGSYRFHERAMVNVGYSYTEIPPVDAGGKTASFHIIP